MAQLSYVHTFIYGWTSIYIWVANPFIYIAYPYIPYINIHKLTYMYKWVARPFIHIDNLSISYISFIILYIV